MESREQSVKKPPARHVVKIFAVKQMGFVRTSHRIQSILALRFTSRNIFAACLGARLETFLNHLIMAMFDVNLITVSVKPYARALDFHTLYFPFATPFFTLKMIK